jgi:hypothetical protein
MAESFTVEVWEYQTLYRQSWVSDEDHPWTYMNFEKCYPPEEISLPSAEWCWATNWRIDCKPGLTDSEGWEYAGKFIRFKIPNRKPKSEKSWNSKARRRMWSRVMRREAGISVRSSDLNKALPRIQSGLSSILQARIQIENIIKKEPDAINSAEMKPLISAVRKNIADILTALDQCDDQQPTLTEQAKIKKLRNDVLKEQLAIEKIINPSFVDRSKQISKRATITGRQSFTARDLRPGESFSRYSEAQIPTKAGSISEQSSSKKNPFDHDYDDAMETPSSLPDSQNTSPTPSFIGNDPKNGIVRGNGVISSYDPCLSSSKSGAVKGGTAGAFDPSVLAGKTRNPFDMGLSDNWETPRDGVFLDRNTQEYMIEQV